MKVIKRDGREELFNFEKIQKMFNFCKHGLNIDEDKFWKEFHLEIYSGITTKQIQQTLINTANKLSIEDLSKVKEYSILANRFFILDWIKEFKLHRENEYKTMTDDYGFFRNADDWIKHLEKYVKLGIYDERILKIPKQTLKKLYVYAKKLQLEYDYNFPFFMWNNFYYQSVKFSKSYIIQYENKPIENFAEALLLISILGFLPDKNSNKYIDYVKQFYKYLLDYLVIPATPQLANLRKNRGNLSSCNILDIHDNLESIFYSYWQIAEISKRGGGIGVYLGRIRPEGSYIQGNKGRTNNILSWCKIIDDILTATNQLGVRKGAGTLALPIWHMDILDFMGIRNPVGEIRFKLFTVYPQVIIPNLFMKRVENDEDWTLVDHYELKIKYDIDLIEVWGKEFEDNYIKAEQLVKEGKIRGKIYKAREIYRQLVKNILASGMPYIFFEDNVNKQSNYTEKILCGNLCVHPETKILTKEYGYIEISKIAGKIVHVWNGKEWSLSSVFKTGENYNKWYEIEFTNGEKIICTDYHRWYVRSSKDKPYERTTKTIVKRTYELKEGDVLEKWDLPIIEGYKTLEYAYENGLFTAEGTDYKFKKTIYLYDKKKKLLKYLDGYYHVYHDKKGERIVVNFKPEVLKEKYFVPDEKYTIESRLRWLEGLFDGDGTNAKNGNTYTLQLSNINEEFLIKVKRMLETLGIQSKIVEGMEEGYRLMPDGKGGKKEYFCKKTKRILISAYNLDKLIQLGFNPKRINFKGMKKPNREAGQFVRIKSIRKLENYISDSYCFYEPKRNRGILNGVLTGNCMEEFAPFKNTNPENIKFNEEIKNIGYIHSCNLISLHLPNLYEKGYLDDYMKLKEFLELVVRYMDNILDVTIYPLKEIEKHNKEYRTIGIGFIGLADLMVKYSIDNNDFIAYRFTSRKIDKNKVKNFTENLFKTFYNIVYNISYNLALERGKADKIDKTKHKKHLRHTQLFCCPPNTSTSIFAGTSASIFPPFNLIQTEKHQNGVYITFPKYLQEGYWYYDEYSKFNEQDLIDIIDIVSTIQKYIDSGISFEYPMNIRDGIINKDEAPTILGRFIYEAWKKGIKTLYYCRVVAKNKDECVSCAN